MIKYGIKVWTRNTAYIPHLRRLGRAGVCDFIELYVDVNAGDPDRDAWGSAGMPVRLHAPHSHGGFNPSLPGQMEPKRAVLKKIDEYRKIFKPASIVFHPGIIGNLQESISQYLIFKEEFPEIFQAALIENKPKIGVKGEICCGAEIQEIQQIIQEAGFNFCLDFGHAICYAAWAQKPWKSVIDAFCDLRPALFHLSDGKVASVRDDHLHFGAGDFDLAFIMNKLPSDACLVIEAKHDAPDNLDDFQRDVDHLKGLEASQCRSLK